MSVVTLLLVLGSAGLASMLLGILLGDHAGGGLDAVLPLDLGPGVVPALGAALAAFGFGGALFRTAGSMRLLPALGLGVVAAVLVGGASLLLARALIGEPVPPARADELFGAFGTVVSPIPAGGLGLVDLVHRGSSWRLSARSEHPLAPRTPVFVVDVLSQTSVLVSPVPGAH